MDKVMVMCPNCYRKEASGRIYGVMGEIKDGFFMIMRHHNAYTKIRGEFEVLCGDCNEPVYFRSTSERRTNGTLNGLQFIYRQTFIGSAIQNAGSQGTALGTLI